MGGNKQANPTPAAPTPTISGDQLVQNPENSVINSTNPSHEMLNFLNSPAGNGVPGVPSYTEQKLSGLEVPIATPTLDETPNPLDFSFSGLSNNTPIATPTETTPVIASTPEIAPMTEVLATDTPIVAEPQIAPMVPLTEENIQTETLPQSVTTQNAETPLFAAEATVLSDSVPVQNTEAPIQESPLFETEAANSNANSSLFDGIVDTQSDASKENNADIFANTQTETPLGENTSGSIFEAKADTQTTNLTASTAEFLEESLRKLDAMEKILLDKKQSYLDQAAEYKTQKEKFATLEKEAKENSHSMDDEQARIDTMRNYFKNQQKKQAEGSEVTESVNTTLTAVGVQNSVDKAIASTTSKKPRRTVTRSKQAA